jgi:hypothetical protein
VLPIPSGAGAALRVAIAGARPHPHGEEKLSRRDLTIRPLRYRLFHRRRRRCLEGDWAFLVLLPGLFRSDRSAKRILARVQQRRSSLLPQDLDRARPCCLWTSSGEEERSVRAVQSNAVRGAPRSNTTQEPEQFLGWGFKFHQVQHGCLLIWEFSSPQSVSTFGSEETRLPFQAPSEYQPAAC